MLNFDYFLLSGKNTPREVIAWTWRPAGRSGRPNWDQKYCANLLFMKAKSWPGIRWAWSFAYLNRARSSGSSSLMKKLKARLLLPEIVLSFLQNLAEFLSAMRIIQQLWTFLNSKARSRRLQLTELFFIWLRLTETFIKEVWPEILSSRFKCLSA